MNIFSGGGAHLKICGIFYVNMLNSLTFSSSFSTFRDIKQSLLIIYNLAMFVQGGCRLKLKVSKTLEVLNHESPT